MKNRYKVEKVEHVWSKKEDRWLYIEYNEQSKVIGLNFMQGDDYDDFKKCWCHNDQGLTDFYESMLYTFSIERASVNTIEFMNKCMWAFHTAAVCKEDHPA